MLKINVGDSAPEFCLPDKDGKEICLKDLEGKWVILYFYPKDNTKGCTIEAIDFTTNLPEFEKMGATVIGISPDSTSSHQKFTEKHGLEIRLLSDVDKNILEQYLSCLEFAFGPTFEIVIVGKADTNDTKDMVKALREVYIPNKIVLFLPEDVSNPEIMEVTDFVKHKTSNENKATAHVCINRFCKFPTNNVDKMLELLKVNKK